ncbi:HesA/MoeB/ThiF family protein [Candidatus Woesearchaeota archaeon]|nr:HesA/MoeB/ThiF family protein [Candidatus Woesearchaeota archaeon]
MAIIGLGGLGSFSTQLLARTGVGELILIDKDKVELKNLQRQILYTEEDIEKFKAEQAAQILQKINSEIIIKSRAEELNEESIKSIKADLVLDCTDNVKTRELINEFALQNKIPWVHATCIREIGRVFNIIHGGPCYKCIYPQAKRAEKADTAGVLNTAVAMTAAIQANEAIKILLNKDYSRQLIRINVWKPEIEMLEVSKNPKCAACGK